MIEDYLIDIGLSEKEAAVYLAMLRVDYVTVSEIAKATGVNRTTVYPVLESLEEKGLVKEIEIKGKNYHQAEAPEALHTFIEKRKLFLSEQSLKLRDFIPKIKSQMRGAGEKPIVKYFEGKQGVLDATDAFISTATKDKKMYSIYPNDKLREIFSDNELSKYRKERKNKGIDILAIYTSSIPRPTTDLKTKSTRILFNSKKYPIKSDIAVYGDKVRIAILGKEVSALFIQSKDLADTIRSLIHYIQDHSE